MHPTEGVFKELPSFHCLCDSLVFLGAEVDPENWLFRTFGDESEKAQYLSVS